LAGAAGAHEFAFAAKRIQAKPNEGLQRIQIKKLSSFLLAAEHSARRQLRHGEPNRASPPECLDGAPLSSTHLAAFVCFRYLASGTIDSGLAQ
jgi:hypothetical protein